MTKANEAKGDNRKALTSEAPGDSRGAYMPMALCRTAAARFSAADPQAATTGEIRMAEAGVAIIPIMGFLSARQIETSWGVLSGRTRRIAERVSAAAADGNVNTIVLHVDSPGGGVDLITETARAIRAARAVKRVVAVVDTMAASAAYWLASQASEVIATPSAELGSIGVFMHHTSIAEMEANHGIEHTFIAAGQYKTEGNMFEPLADSARRHLQSQVDSIYDKFVEDVAAGRGISEDIVRGETFGQGRTLLAEQAAAVKMCDRIDTAQNVLASLVGTSGQSPRGRRAMATQESDDLRRGVAMPHRNRFFY